MSIPCFDDKTGTETARFRCGEVTLWADDTGRIRSASGNVTPTAKAAEKRRRMFGLPSKVRT